MTGVDAHGLLREQILAVTRRCREMSETDMVTDLMPIVEAANAAARRDALNEAADEIVVDSRDNLIAHDFDAGADAVYAALRARAAAPVPATPDEAHVFDWREDIMGNYVYRCCDNGQSHPIHEAPACWDCEAPITGTVIEHLAHCPGRAATVYYATHSSTDRPACFDTHECETRGCYGGAVGVPGCMGAAALYAQATETPR